jgi:hypothetical protein
MSVTREIRRRLPAGQSFRPFEPCLPRPAKEPRAGSDWIHEIKHDGFRILARRDARGVRLFTRNGYDFAVRFPRIVEAIESLPVRSCFIDGEAIVVDATGLSVFDLIRYRQHDRQRGVHALPTFLNRRLSVTTATMPPRSSNMRSESNPMTWPTTSSPKRGRPIAGSVPASLGNGCRPRRAFLPD